mgnify:CR=1 FL=1|jgi:hypothetical protein
MVEIMNLFSAFGLSTAAGLNAYVPLLAVGLIARYTSLIQLSEPFDLLVHPIVLIVLAVLAILDFIGDKVPAVDHALHAVGMFIAPVAGAILFMASNSEAGAVHPMLAAICGLLLAGGAHSVRTAVRPMSTVTTGGVGNPIVSFLEDIASVVLSIVAILLPILAFIAVVAMAVMVVMLYRRFRRPTARRL